MQNQFAGSVKVVKPRPHRAPDQTFEEISFLRSLIDRKAAVRVRLLDDEEVDGVIEYYDQSFIRLTCNDEPNLFIFKHDIKYLYEVA